MTGSARLPLRCKACREFSTAGNWKKQHLEMKRRGERNMWISQEQQQSIMVRSMRSKKGNCGRCQMGKKKDLSCQEIWLWMQSAKEQLGNVQTLWWRLVDTCEKHLISILCGKVWFRVCKGFGLGVDGFLSGGLGFFCWKGCYSSPTSWPPSKSLVSLFFWCYAQ